LSKVIHHSEPVSTVYIGEKHLDFEKDALAEQKLISLFPLVSVVTDADGAKLIPIQEILLVARIYEEQLHKTRQEGYDEGHRAGLNQGRSEGETQTRQVLRQFEQAIQDAVGQREELLKEAKQRILELVIQISRKVTFDAISVDPEVTLSMISGVIDTLVDRTRLKIKVNPRHQPIVEQNIERFLQESPTLKEVSIEPDPRVRYGGCFIETPTGDIDARLESQLEVIEETLLTDVDSR
jgi:flagellar assembly protein FliH